LHNRDQRGVLPSGNRTRTGTVFIQVNKNAGIVFIQETGQEQEVFLKR